MINLFYRGLMNDNLSIALQNALRHYFGYEQFRQGQEEIINEIMNK